MMRMARIQHLTLALAMLLFLLTSPDFELFHANQHTYFPHGLRLALEGGLEGRNFLASDWYANTAALHLAFAYLVAALDSLAVLELSLIPI